MFFSVLLLGSPQSFFVLAFEMGGHGHGHHHEPYTVPKPETWTHNQVDKIYELNILKTELAKRGLKDPWIRFVINK